MPCRRIGAQGLIAGLHGARRIRGYGLVLALMLLSSGMVDAASIREGDQSHFYIAGKHASASSDRLMYVRVLRAARPVGKQPIVMIHGAAQTGEIWLATPDGRPGWARYFAEQGHDVYVVDQPGSGRSEHLASYGPQSRLGTNQIERLFTAPARFSAWPQAKLHTQFPGKGPNKGRAGDPVFDRFLASQVPFVGRAALGEDLLREAGAALLDRIGAAVLVTHSQSGPYGWVIADARPKLVKAIVAIEPTGPPMRNEVIGKGAARPWGLTETSLAYEPPIRNPQSLSVVVQAVPDAPNLAACVRQVEPARKLIRLQAIPVLVLVAEASYHAVYDHCTAKWLRQAGVETNFVRLEDAGIRGNGHMMMIETNNLVIAALIGRWLDANVR